MGYQLKVDPNQDDKATEIKIFNFSRPHMRAFHCSWWCFFIAFFIWFAIAPLLGEIKDTLGLTKQQIRISCSFLHPSLLLRHPYFFDWNHQQRNDTYYPSSFHWFRRCYFCSMPILDFQNVRQERCWYCQCTRWWMG